MPACQELERLFNASEALQEPPAVHLFDLTQPEERERLNSHLIWETVEIEGKSFSVLFWTERNEQNEIISVQQIETRDIVDSQLERLFLIQNPDLIFDYKRKDPAVLEQLKSFKEETIDEEQKFFGTAYYYPNTRTLIRGVGPDLDAVLRTSSNRGLISKQEQERLSQFNVCFLGLSVGSSGLRTWQKEGDSIKVAGGDPGFLDESNLNRVWAARSNIGDNKTGLAIHQVLEHNPFIQTDLSSEGLSLLRNEQGIDSLAEYLLNIEIQNSGDIERLSDDQVKKILDEVAEIVVRKENFGQMFDGINAVVEEMDDLRMKILARLGARKLRIPVLMASDMSDTVLLDIERFDQEPERRIFHGLVDPEILLKAIAFPSPESFTSVATAITGREYMPDDFAEALSKIGKSLISPPQLASTIACAAGILTKRLREIALGQLEGSWRELYDFAEFKFQKFQL